jgi:hypothetical protein
MAKRCDQCLFSKNRIVSAVRKRELLATCKRDDTHFVCHKASIAGESVCCRVFYDADPGASNLMRIAGRLGAVEFVERGALERIDETIAAPHHAPMPQAPRGPGRPPKSASGPQVMVSLRLPPEDRDALRELAAALKCPQSEIVQMGIAAARRKTSRIRAFAK